MIETPAPWELLAKAQTDAPAKPRQCTPCARGERPCRCGQPGPTAEQVRDAAMPFEGRQP